MTYQELTEKVIDHLGRWQYTDKREPLPEDKVFIDWIWGTQKEIISDIHSVIQEIKIEIDSRPQYPNIGKKGCLKRLNSILNKWDY